MSREFKEKASALGMILLAGVVALTGAVVVLGTDFVWDGDGGNTNWTNASNWVIGSGFPQDYDNDNATITDTSPSSTCTMDRTTSTAINDLVLGGSSPTKMRLNVTGAPLVSWDAYLNDYAAIDADQNMTVTNDTFVAGDIWFDTANGTTIDLNDVLLSGSATPTATLHLNTAGTGALEMTDLWIDAETANATQGIKLMFDTNTVAILNELKLVSDDEADNRKAKLWLHSGTLEIGFGSGGWERLTIDGGSSVARRVEIDQDGTIHANQIQVKSGYAALDVESGKALQATSVAFDEGAILTVTGGGTFEIESE